MTGVNRRAKNKLKNQASVDLLTTYGFMILIVAVAIIAIYYLTASSKSVLPSQCNAYGGIKCSYSVYESNTYTQTGNIQIHIYNSESAPINVITTNMIINGKSYSSSCYPDFIAPGANAVCSIHLSSTEALGYQNTGYFNINVQTCNSGSSQFSTTNCTYVPISYAGAFTSYTQPLYLPCYPLSLSASGTGMVSANISTSGGCTDGYIPGTKVQISGTPNSGSVFSSWTGTGEGNYSGTSNPSVITFGNTSITEVGTFVGCYSLTLSSSGPGSAAANPTSNGGCSNGNFASGSSTTITGTASPGYVLSGWTCTGTNCYSGPQTSDLITFGNTPITETANFESCLALTLSGAGIQSANPANTVGCPSGTFKPGDLTTLSETPQTGYIFTDWSCTGTNCYSGSNPSPQITFGTTSITETASYATCLALSLQKTGSGTVNASPSSANGCSSGQFTPGTAVNISAVPSAGYGFAGWTCNGLSCYSGTSSSNTIIFGNTPITETGNFGQCYPLSLSGAGTQSASPVNTVDCPNSAYTSGAKVALSENAPSGYSFTSWTCTGTNCYSGTNSTPTITFGNAMITETANYGFCYTLSEYASGSGSVSANPANAIGCPASEFTPGSNPKLGEQPASGNIFSTWTGTGTGSYTGSSTSPTITFSTNSITETATFLSCYPLTLSGAGTQSASPSGTTGCSSGTFTSGTETTLSAVPPSGEGFSSWTGTGTGSYTGTTQSPQITFSTSPITESASYISCYVLTLQSSPSGDGTPLVNISSSGGCPSGQYVANTKLALTQSPGSSSTFQDWTCSGTNCYSGTSSSVTITFGTSAITETANYQQCYSLSISGGYSSPTSSSGCGSYQFSPGTGVTLYPSIPGGDGFNSWSCSGTNCYSGTTEYPTISFGYSSISETANYGPCVALYFGSTVWVSDTYAFLPSGARESPGCSSPSYAYSSPYDTGGTFYFAQGSTPYVLTNNPCSPGGPDYGSPFCNTAGPFVFCGWACYSSGGGTCPGDAQETGVVMGSSEMYTVPEWDTRYC